METKSVNRLSRFSTDTEEEFEMLSEMPALPPSAEEKEADRKRKLESAEGDNAGSAKKRQRTSLPAEAEEDIVVL